jgi:hypothetical protein
MRQDDGTFRLLWEPRRDDLSMSAVAETAAADYVDAQDRSDGLWTMVSSFAHRNTPSLLKFRSGPPFSA